MVDVQGACDPRFETVRAAFAKNFAVSGDVGASAAVMIDGELVVDLWGGHADAARTDPWQRDTIVIVFSSTKTMTALCALLLADRGELDLHAPVGRYWPEFAANGKERIAVRSASGCAVVLEEQANGVDLVLGAPLRLGMGYGLNTGPRPMTPNPRSCFWGGAGGSLVVVDMDLHLVVAYAMNQMAGGTLGDARAARILRATYGSLAA